MLHSPGRYPSFRGIVKLALLLSVILISCSPFGTSIPQTVTPTIYPSSAPAFSSPSSIRSSIDCHQPQTAPGKVSLDGLGYGPYHTGQDPNFSIAPSAAEVGADMPTLASLTRNIRIYSSLGPADDIINASATMGMCVNLGIWLGKSSGANTQFSYPKKLSGQGAGTPCPVINSEDMNAREINDDTDNANSKEIMAGIRLASNPAVHSITVGNEVLLRGDLTENQLSFILDQVRAHLSRRVPITLADDYSQWLCHPDLAKHVDFITIHIYPFWNGISIDNAINFLDAKYQAVKKMFPNKLIVLGETGWPSAGPPQGAAVPGPANQVRYLKEFTAWAQLNGVQYYYFDAFDESWKTNESGVGTHWGLYQQNGQVKPTLKDILPPPDPATLEQRSYLDVYVGSALEEGFGLGINTSDQQQKWLTNGDGILTLNYPQGQLWGTMFITAGPPVPPGNRPSVDLSAYHSLVFEIRTFDNRHCIRLGIKDRTQPDDGSEITVPTCLAKPQCAQVRAPFYDGSELSVPKCVNQWSTIALPLNTFANVDLAHLYVAFEVNFLGTASAGIQLRNIRYSPARVPPVPILPTPVPFNVYTDLGDVGNHYVPTGWMGDYNAMKMTENWKDNPHSGTTCIQVVYSGIATQGNRWAGVYWQDPVNNWGKTPGPTGYDLSHLSQLTFWVRGRSGGEQVQFLVGGIAGPYPDSLQPALMTPVITLTTNWQQITIPLAGKNLTHIIGGFGLVVSNTNNPNGATFYLDDIVYSA
jgi:exo-beta-1,3-glucanase (GH17 family)